MLPDSIPIRRASDGYEMHSRVWVPDESPRGWVVMLHGIQSHSGWYDFSGRTLSNHGFHVRSVDRRGSGLNVQDRGDVVDWQRLVSDVVHFLKDARQERSHAKSRAPVILMGISWGGKLATAMARLRPELVDALALITPGIWPRIKPNRLQRLQLSLARRCGVMRKRVEIPLNDPELFTSVPQWQDFIRQDPLALHEVTTSFLIASARLDQIARRVTPLHCPLLLMLAEEDRIIDSLRTRRFFDRIAPRSHLTVCYKRVRHTLEFDQCRDEYVANLAHWMKLCSESGPHRPAS